MPVFSTSAWRLLKASEAQGYSLQTLLLQVFIQALGEGFDQFVFVEKFLEDDAQHRVGRDGKYHAGDARHAADV